MQAFSELLDRLILTASRNTKIALMVNYFRQTPDPARGWALAVLTGELDIPGVKGGSIRRLVEHLGIEESRVLVAGDTLNDLSMLECGLPAVAVGNSEPELVSRVAHLPHVHYATAHGAAGIMEAIAAFDLHPKVPYEKPLGA